MKVARKYALPTYWLAFALIAAVQGKQPGFLLDPQDASYQWGSVIFVWLLLAIIVLMLHKIIDPLNYSVSSPRFGKAFGLSVLLLLLFSLFYVTDLPPVLYLPHTFTLVTAALMLVCAAIETIVLAVRNRA